MMNTREGRKERGSWGKKPSDYWAKNVREFDSIYTGKKSRFARYLDSTFRWDMFERFSFTMSTSEPITDRTFLDVGCGTGWYALEFGRRNARYVVGIDISEAMLNVARKRVLAEGLKDRVSFVHADFLEFEPQETFDVAIAIGLMDYIYEPLPFLKKLKTCVKDRAILSFPRAGTWRALARKIRLNFKGCKVFFYSQDRIMELMERAEFGECKINPIGELYLVSAR